MHDKTHRNFVRPENENTKIWRYMDCLKFISLLQRGLFFVIVRALDDPYEATMPKCNQTEIRNDDRDAPPPVIIEAELERLRRTALINSWHINDYESAAMWDLYSI
jgi:hypothetical protein